MTTGPDWGPSGGSDGPDQRPSSLDPAQLMERAGRGDEAAFAALYDLYAGVVHGIVLRVIRDPAQAQEVTQEVFLEIWQQAPRYDGTRGSVRSWVAVIAHRRAVDRVRAEQARTDREDRQERLDPVSTPADDPVVDTVGRRLDRDRVRRAMDRLSDVQRQAVELAYFQGYTYRQVAVALDTPEGTVKTRIRDGMARLRAALEVTR